MLYYTLLIIVHKLHYGFTECKVACMACSVKCTQKMKSGIANHCFYTTDLDFPFGLTGPSLGASLSPPNEDVDE